MSEAKTAPDWRLLRWGAIALSLVCAGWVVRPLLEHSAELSTSFERPTLVALVGVGSLLYVGLSTLLAHAWWTLVQVYGERPRWRDGFSVFARSQLAKYLPSNALHYVGRQLLGRRLGLTHGALVASGVLEMGSLLAAALLLAPVALVAPGRLPTTVPLLVAAATAFTCLVGWSVADRILRRWSRTAAAMVDLPVPEAGRSARLLAQSVAAHLAFFVGTGWLLVFLVVAIAGSAGGAAIAHWRIAAAFAVAWAAGTATPGAPGGAGVREAVLTLQLTPMVGEGPAALAAVTLRVVTLAGDLLTGLAGRLAKRRETK